ncbi:hypothetical protein [Micromonospora tarensis]|uniref:hypothetical protein n=1 Tax=Micromonospora tarensis TaxID=2806100 RepID=UPI001EE3AF7E|nr:hypothetical protein [Micromonospora tarensis]
MDTVGLPGAADAGPAEAEAEPTADAVAEGDPAGPAPSAPDGDADGSQRCRW